MKDYSGVFFGINQEVVGDRALHGGPGSCLAVIAH